MSSTKIPSGGITRSSTNSVSVASPLRTTVPAATTYAAPVVANRVNSVGSSDTPVVVKSADVIPAVENNATTAVNLNLDLNLLSQISKITFKDDLKKIESLASIDNITDMKALEKALFGTVTNADDLKQKGFEDNQFGRYKYIAYLLSKVELNK